MTKTYMRMSLASKEQVTPIAPFRSDVVFTREQLSQDLPLRPLPIRHGLKALHCFNSRLSTHVPAHVLAEFEGSSSKKRSAFLRKLPSNERATPKYLLPMKRSSSRYSIPQLSLEIFRTPDRPSTPDTMLSSLESAQSTPQSRHSQNFIVSPPSLNYQIFLIEQEEKSVPLNILLPSL